MIKQNLQVLPAREASPEVSLMIDGQLSSKLTNCAKEVKNKCSNDERFSDVISLTAHQKIKLQKRIQRFIDNYPNPLKKLLIHPDDVLEAFALRDYGLIPNLPIKVLGGGYITKITNKFKGNK